VCCQTSLLLPSAMCGNFTVLCCFALFFFCMCRVEDILRRFYQPVSNKRRKLDTTSITTTSTTTSVKAGNAHVQYVRYYREGQRTILRELLDELEGILDSAEGDQESEEESEEEDGEEGEEEG